MHECDIFDIEQLFNHYNKYVITSDNDSNIKKCINNIVNNIQKEYNVDVIKLELIEKEIWYKLCNIFEKTNSIMVLTSQFQTIDYIKN